MKYSIFQNMFQWKCNELDAEGRKQLESQHVDRKCITDIPYIERRENFFRALPLIYDDHFKDEVNVNYSVVKVVTNVYERGNCLNFLWKTVFTDSHLFFITFFAFSWYSLYFYMVIWY